MKLEEITPYIGKEVDLYYDAENPEGVPGSTIEVMVGGILSLTISPEGDEVLLDWGFRLPVTEIKRITEV